jgi:hypothetical protein
MKQEGAERKAVRQEQKAHAKPRRHDAGRERG